MYVFENPIEKTGEEHAIHTGEVFARKWGMDDPKVIQKVADQCRGILEHPSRTVQGCWALGRWM